MAEIQAKASALRAAAATFPDQEEGLCSVTQSNTTHVSVLEKVCFSPAEDHSGLLFFLLFLFLHRLPWEISNSLAATLGSCLLFQNFMIEVVLEFLTAAIRKMGLLSLRHFTSSPARRQQIPALQFSQYDIKFDPGSIRYKASVANAAAGSLTSEMARQRRTLSLWCLCTFECKHPISTQTPTVRHLLPQLRGRHPEMNLNTSAQTCGSSLTLHFLSPYFIPAAPLVMLVLWHHP